MLERWERGGIERVPPLFPGFVASLPRSQQTQMTRASFIRGGFQWSLGFDAYKPIIDDRSRMCPFIASRNSSRVNPESR